MKIKRVNGLWVLTVLIDYQVQEFASRVSIRDAVNLAMAAKRKAGSL